MITKLGDRIARALVLSGMASEEEQELYSYGFFLLLSRGLFLLVTAAFGAIWGVLWESVLYYALFSLLRGYAGGIHAEKESTCLICTTVAMLSAVSLIRWLEAPGNGEVGLGMLLVGLAGVLLFSPLDTSEKHLSPEERIRYRRQSLATAFAAVTGSLAIAALGWFVPLAITAPAMALEGLLLTAGAFRNTKIRKNT